MSLSFRVYSTPRKSKSSKRDENPFSNVYKYTKGFGRSETGRGRGVGTKHGERRDC